MTARLYTIVYQGLKPDEFLDILKQNGIEAIIDVRENPHSRKRGFSLKHLAAMGSANGMEYYSLRSLGSPAVLRQKLRQDEDHHHFNKAYKEYLKGQNETLHKVASMLQQKTCCLLCYESNPDSCHRKIVAQELAGIVSKLQIIHLG